MKNKKYYEKGMNIDKVFNLIDDLQRQYTFEELMKAFREIVYDEVAYHSEANHAPLYSEDRDQLNIEQANRLQQRISAFVDLYTQSIVDKRTFDEGYLKQYNI